MTRYSHAKRDRLGVAVCGQLCSHPVAGRAPLQRVKNYAASESDALLTGKKPQDILDQQILSWKSEERLRWTLRSRAIAAALERQSVAAYRRYTPIVRVDLVDLEETYVENYKNIYIIPNVFLRNTRNIRNELYAYIHAHQVSGTSIVIGQGWKTVDEILPTKQALSRIISRIAVEIREKFNADIFFSNTEIKLQSLEVSKNFRYHVHSHVLVDHAFMRNNLYQEMCSFIKEKLKDKSSFVSMQGFSTDDAPALSRYVTKFPLDFNGFEIEGEAEIACARDQILGGTLVAPVAGRAGSDADAPLKILSDAELAALAIAVRKTKFLRPLGGLAQWRRQFIASDGESRARLEGAAGDDGGPIFVAVRRKKRQKSRITRCDSSEEDIIVSRTAPTARDGRRYTPALLIIKRSRRPIIETLRSRNVLHLVDDARALYNARVPPEERYPILLPDKLVKGARFEVRNGIRFAISLRAEAIDRQCGYVPEPVTQTGRNQAIPVMNLFQTAGRIIPMRPPVVNVTAARVV